MIWEDADPGYSFSGRKAELMWEKEQLLEEAVRTQHPWVGRSGLSNGRRVLWLDISFSARMRLARA